MRLRALTGRSTTTEDAIRRLLAMNGGPRGYHGVMPMRKSSVGADDSY